MQAFPSVASPPPPPAYFVTLSQFPSRSQAFGKGKETAATASSHPLSLLLILPLFRSFPPVHERLEIACIAGGIRERASGGEAGISSHGVATRVHGFATKTKALTHEIPSATQAIWKRKGKTTNKMNFDRKNAP